MMKLPLKAETGVHVVLSTDDKFRIGLLATTRSIARHLPESVSLEVNVFDCGLSDPAEVEAVLSRNLAGRATVRLRQVPLDRLDRMSLNRANLSRAAFARLLAPSLLPDLDRVLYLDSDLLVTANLCELWNTGLNGAPLGAVPDPHYIFLGQDVANCRELGIHPFHRYFGSGVLLVDLAQWRRENAEARLMELGQPGRLQRQFNDQSILNAYFAGRVHYLPRRWNQLRFHWNGSGAFLPLRRGIVHVGGAPKPWQFPAEGSVGVNRLYHEIMEGAEVPTEWQVPADAVNPRRTPRAALQSAKLAFRSSRLGWVNGIPFACRQLRNRRGASFTASSKRSTADS